MTPCRTRLLRACHFHLVFTVVTGPSQNRAGAIYAHGSSHSFDRGRAKLSSWNFSNSIPAISIFNAKIAVFGGETDQIVRLCFSKLAYTLGVDHLPTLRPYAELTFRGFRKLLAPHCDTFSPFAVPFSVPVISQSLVNPLSVSSHKTFVRGKIQ